MTEEDDLPPKEETALDAARGRFIRVKMDAGWKRESNWTVHPTDPDMRFIIDPFTGEITFSPKLVDQLDADGSADEMVKLIREDIERQRRSGTR